MARQIKTARLFNKMTMVEAGEKLGVAQPTLSAWETQRKSPSVDALERMADLYGVTTDYLLGRPESACPEPTQPLNIRLISVLDGMPVWSEAYGWMLVCAGEKHLITPTGETIPFSEADDLYISPKAFTFPSLPNVHPVEKSQLGSMTEIWLEPISSDAHMREELRGWYRIKGSFAENRSGNRFSLDSYALKWLAFNEVRED